MANETPSASCYEARLWLGLDNTNKRIIGTLDGKPIEPIEMRPILETLETTTSLKYDPTTRSIIFENERSVKGIGPADYVSSREILSGAILPEIGGVRQFVDGGLASVVDDGNSLGLQFIVPTPIEIGEVSSGFITYVASPNTPGLNYRLIQPDTGAVSDTVFIGHPDGSVEFASPINSPVLVPLAGLVGGTGVYSGTPATIGSTNPSYHYQDLGTSQVITNTSGSKVEVTLTVRVSLSSGGGHNGLYCALVNGGSDYKTTFAEGGTNIKTELSLGGQVSYTVVLTANQRVQFRFGAWADQTGTLNAVVGSVDEGGHQISLPVINIRRII